jgi:hypothetical protein
MTAMDAQTTHASTSPTRGDRTEHSIVIEPIRGWASLGLRDVWEYRELLYFLLWREVKDPCRV